MSGIVNVADTFGEFILDLRLKRPEVLVHMSSLCNGFEGWLKFEFYFWLLTHKNLKPENEDIGLEYKLEIKDSYYLAIAIRQKCLRKRLMTLGIWPKFEQQNPKHQKQVTVSS